MANYDYGALSPLAQNDHIHQQELVDLKSRLKIAQDLVTVYKKAAEDALADATEARRETVKVGVALAEVSRRLASLRVTGTVEQTWAPQTDFSREDD
jgi:hypothetical protein